MPFQIGETVVCSIEVRTTADVLADPATSMTITIKGPTGAEVVSAAAMTKDSTGKYHSDYTVAAGPGTYEVDYTATDGARITKHDDSFSADY